MLRGRQTERQERQRPRGTQKPSPLTPTLTEETDPQTHTLSERGAEGVAWAWQLLAPSQCHCGHGEA